jgi:intracellular septation protein A
MASTLIYLAVFSLTKSIPIAAAVGLAMGVGEMVWERSRGKKIEALQWLSLALVVVASVGALITNDFRFILIKGSVVYAVVGAVMLKPGWMNRYLPAEALEYVPDLGVGFGFVWAGLMFVSAAVNVVAALTLSLTAWVAFMSAYALATKLALFAIQYATMRFVGRRRYARRLAGAALPDAVAA